MVALSNSITATSASVLGLSASTGQQTSSFISSTRAPKTTNDLIAQSINPNPASLARQPSNVAVPSQATLVQPDQPAQPALLAVSLNSSTTVDALVKQSNNAFASETQAATAKPIARASVETLKAPETASTAPRTETVDNTTSTSSITNTGNTSEKAAVAAASQAYTTTANYGQSGAGGSGTFSLSA